MNMQSSNLLARALRLAAALVAFSVLGYFAVCQEARKPFPEPAGKNAAKEPSGPELPANLGEPLLDNASSITRLDPSSPVWIDKQNKQIVLLGSVCQANYPLEFFATYPDRGYEAVVVVYTRPSVVHAGLLALGAKSGKGAQYRPNFIPPSGTPVQIGVIWKDADGKRHQAAAQDWVRDIKTKKPLDVTWVFAGSIFWTDESTGAKSYLADRGDFISVASLPTAMLDLPVESATAIESRTFEGFIERLPPPGTPVTLTLKPKLATTHD
jgi:hypothetical protein